MVTKKTWIGGPIQIVNVLVTFIFIKTHLKIYPLFTTKERILYDFITLWKK